MIVNYIYIYTYMCVIISILLVLFPLHACILEFSERTNQRIQWPSRSNLQGGLRSGAGFIAGHHHSKGLIKPPSHSIFYPSIYGFLIIHDNPRIYVFDSVCPSTSLSIYRIVYHIHLSIHLSIDPLIFLSTMDS